MAYTPTTWTSGDIITSQKLNKIENGVANAELGNKPLIIDISNDTLTKTAGEIYDAYTNGIPIYIRFLYGSPDTVSGYQRLIPVTHLHNYGYADVIRIIATSSIRTTIGGNYYSYVPATFVFKATSLSDYPIYDRTYYVTASNMSTIASLIST